MKIPEYDTRVALASPGPAPTISAQAAAAPWLALEKVGEQTAELGKVIQDKQDEIFRANEIHERALQAESEIGDLMIELEQERDPQNAPEKFSERMVDIKNRAMDGVNDYKVATSLTGHLGNREIDGVTKVRHAAWVWTLENDQQDMMAQNDRWKRAAANNPDQVDFAAGMIRGRVASSISTGSIKPETGRALADKEVKDLYSQVMGQMILTNPRTAPEMIKPLLAKSGLDPTDMWAMEQRAEHAKASFESRAAKGDKVLWDANAGRASIQIRSGKLTEQGVTTLFETSQIGPDQLHYLHSVLDSTTTRKDVENSKTSNHAVNAILNDVMFNRVSPEVAARRIDMNSSVLPEHKTSAMQLLLSIGKKADSIPPQFEKAMQLYRTTIAPSSFSMNPKQEEMEALGNTMREAWTDYFLNEKKYQTDPDLLIKRAIEKTKPEAVSNSVPQSTAKDLVELLKQYDYYVTKRNPSPNGKISKSTWEAWFKQKGGTMPLWTN